MATGQVKLLYAKRPVPVIVIGRGSTPQWSEVFENNPKLTRRPGTKLQVLRNGSGMRPYIVQKTATKWIWRPSILEPGEMFFSQAEKEFAEPYRGMVLIEPNTKVPNGNKAWIWDRWQRVVDESGLDFVQVGAYESRWLEGVTAVPTTFRYAAAVLSVCRAFVGAEGALHHAAAALGVPAVVLWAEFISPAITGYASQTNIRHAGEPCGSRVPCEGCRQSMKKITVEEVLSSLRDIA